MIRMRRRRHTPRNLEKGDLATNLLKAGYPLLATWIGMCEARNRHPRPASALKLGATGSAAFLGIKSIAEPLIAAAKDALS